LLLAGKDEPFARNDASLPARILSVPRKKEATGENVRRWGARAADLNMAI
jgi:hypothetical protein